MFSVASPAQASCAPPQPRIIWSYPADGATGVPTNARVFILTPGGLSSDDLRVNGQVVRRDASDARPGWNVELAPSTQYTVELPSYQPIIRFSTAAGPLSDSLPLAPVVARTTLLRERSLSPLCSRALSVGECFDTPPYNHFVFETEARPLFFVVLWTPPAVYPPYVPRPPPSSSPPPPPAPLIWPGECGHPEIFGKNFDWCFGSYRIWSVGITGESVASDLTCNPPPTLPVTPAPTPPPATPAPSPAPPPRAGGDLSTAGCSLAGRGGGSVCLPVALLVVLVLIARRPGRPPGAGTRALS